MPCRRVGAHAQHHRAPGGDLVVRVAKATRLPVAAGRVVFRVKIKHDRLAAKLAERHFAAAVGRRGEARRRGAFPEFHLLHAGGSVGPRLAKVNPPGKNLAARGSFP
ncbi:uncharacterized protein METZ01_LOCUS239949 [marine metagenome]|uniref:Uncharacterized protein n=1 Tax=marine metagenome TaxID=408172 RepID=A0A382HJ51_9ZZZZ